MAIIKCPECGQMVSDHAKACPSCGIEIEGKIMECPVCGEIIFKNQKECPSCHHPLGAETPQEAQACPPESAESDVDTTPSGDASTGEAPRQDSHKHTKLVTAIIVAAVVVAIAVLSAIYIYDNQQQQNEAEAYTAAMENGAQAVLQNYLDIYTDAPQAHRDSVEARLEKLKAADTEWANAVASGSKTAIERYLQLHPSSVHNMEAKIKIDSLDWLEASRLNTQEAYKTYIDEHADGLYVDDARSKLDKIDALTVTPEEQQAISSLFAAYFTSLGSNDADGLTACLASIMDSYLHKENATKADVIRHMEKMHDATNVTNIAFRLNNDWNIKKQDMGEGKFNYDVTFSVDQKTSYTETDKSTFNTFNVEAKVNPDFKISELNMKRIVQKAQNESLPATMP